ncbi:unnamed protein product, partial [Staurois parvus]
ACTSICKLRLLTSDWAPELRKGTQAANHLRGGGAWRGGAERQREDRVRERPEQVKKTADW